MWKTPTVLILIVLTLAVFGIVMLASTSGLKALVIYNDPNYFVKRQGAWLVLGLVAAAITAKIDYHHWRFFAIPILILAVALLVLVFVPGIGVKIGGSRRWLHLGFMSFQPSELGKFALILMLAWWLARQQRRVREFFRGAVMPAIFLGSIAGLIFIEPDFGTTLLCAVVGLAIMFVGGSRAIYLGVFAVTGLSLFSAAVMRDAVRMSRILAFLEPDKYAQTYSFQLINAIKAFIMGGTTGVGLGESMQKHYYLPEAHTDFIFAIIGEELGIGATLAVVLLFAALFFCGLRISFRAPDMFGRLMAFGIIMMITLQALINIGVVTGCLPTKGLPLPFISFGGSSLVLSLASIGVLLNIALHARGEILDEESRSVKDRLHSF